MFTWIVDTVFPALGELFGYFQAFAQLPTMALFYLFKGNTFSWEVLNIFTNETFLVTFYSYDALFEIANGVPLLGVITRFLEVLVGGVGESLYYLLFGVPFTSADLFIPMLITIPIAFLRGFVLFTVLRALIDVLRGA